MLSRFGIETSQAAQYVIAFVIILVLVALFGLVLRRLAGGRLMLPGQDRGRARQPRLGIVDIYDLDRQRQLILLRRDNVEHLLLIGGPNDLVVETNIVRVPGARLPSPAATETVVDRSEIAPERAEPVRPQVEGARPSLEAQIAARLSALSPDRPSGTSDAHEELAPVAAARAPVQARIVEPALKPDPVAPSPVPPQPAPLRAQRPEPPARGTEVPPPRLAPVAAATLRPEPRPTPPEQRPGVPEPRPAAPEPRPAAADRRAAAPEPRPAPAPLRPAPPPPPEPRGPEAAVLSNMARQLEEALRRPAAPIQPQAAPPQSAPSPAFAARDGARDPVPQGPGSALQPAATVPPPRPRPTITASLATPWPSGGAARPAPSAPAGSETPLGAPAAPGAPGMPPGTQAGPADVVAPPSAPAVAASGLNASPRPPAGPVGPAGVPPAPPREAPSPPPPPPAIPAEPRAVDDPFSVEEIEAEFARLLGRPAGGDRT